jgi:hypothetical protein
VLSCPYFRLFVSQSSCEGGFTSAISVMRIATGKPNVWLKLVVSRKLLFLQSDRHSPSVETWKFRSVSCPRSRIMYTHRTNLLHQLTSEERKRDTYRTMSFPHSQRLASHQSDSIKEGSLRSAELQPHPPVMIPFSAHAINSGTLCATPSRSCAKHSYLPDSSNTSKSSDFELYLYPMHLKSGPCRVLFVRAIKAGDGGLFERIGMRRLGRRRREPWRTGGDIASSGLVMSEDS